MMEEKSEIQLANERMSIIEACNLLGMDVMDFSISSLKTYCPFGHITHEDGGQSKAFRIYPGTNSAWCFACQVYFTPVKLIAMDKDISEPDAAQWILETTNYIPPDYLSKWEALTREEDSGLDLDSLAEALKVFCARMSPDWDAKQFDDDVSRKLRLCLGLLPKVRTKGDADKWLTTTKQVMSKTLGVS